MAYKRAQKKAPEYTPITQNTPLFQPELDGIEGALNELVEAANSVNKIYRQLELRKSISNLLYAVSKPSAKLNTYVNDMIFLPIVHAVVLTISDVFAVGGESVFENGLLTAYSQGDYTLAATYDLGLADNINAIKLSANDVLLESISTSANNVNWEYPSYYYYTDVQLHRNPLYTMIGNDTYIIIPNSNARYVRLTFRQQANERIEVSARFLKQHYETEGEITFGPIPIKRITTGKVYFLVDYLVPASFDNNTEYVQFYVSINGTQFVRCRANVESGYHGVQVNCPHPLLTTPFALRTDDPIDEIFIKCYLTRPVEHSYSTPLIRQVIPYVDAWVE